jgi:hypothetical protein
MNASRKLLFLATLMLFPVAVWGAAGDPGTGLASTAHDFSGITSNGSATGSCTFCHTPHKASAQGLIWNHDLSVATFDWTTPQSTGGTNYVDLPADTYKGSTAKCLSCHDGTVAIGDIGWWAGSDPGTVATVPATMDATHTVGGAAPGSAEGNHPVAMPYPFENAVNTYNTAATGAGVILGEFVADPTTNKIRLYNDDGSGNITVGAVSAKSGMECGSCHDPHNGAATTEDVMFLRGLIGGNTANYICVKCHSK